VLLLMFAVGVQFSLDELNHVRKTALVGGGVQIGGTIALGVLLGLPSAGAPTPACSWAARWRCPRPPSCSKRWKSGGSLGTRARRGHAGHLVVQDLSLVLMIVLLPAVADLGTQGTGALASVGNGAAQSLAVPFVIVLLTTRGVPACWSG
jgi:CPA2 family monovalent cation:H+ antiporter-2